MSPRRTLLRLAREAAFWLLATLTLATGVVTVLIFSGWLVAGEPRDSATAAETTFPVEPDSEPARRAATRSVTATKPKAPVSSARASRAQSNVFVVSAARGDCWVQARAGSGTGRVLFEGVLARGRSVRLEATRVWLRLGAAANVDMVVDGRPRALPPGTVDVLVDERSAGSAAA